jgi:hypothetical protein
MQSERTLGLDAFSRVRRGRNIDAIVGDAPSGRALRDRIYVWAYSRLLRPMLYADELQYLQCVDELERYGSLPPQERVNARTTPDGEPPVPRWAILTRVVAPVFKRIDLRFESATAQRRLLQTALGLQVYRQRHGRYPTTLAELRAMGCVVPVDNFSEQDFVYRPVGRGYLLYSVGPDLADDGGRPHWTQLPQQEGVTPRYQPPPITASGDLVWPEPGVPTPYGFSE